MRIVSYGKTFVDNVTVDTKLSNGQLGICTAYGTALPTTGRPEPFVIMSAIPTKDGGFMNQRGVDINPFNFTYNVRKYTEKDQKETIILKGLTNPALKSAEGIVYNADAEFCGAIEICSSEEYRHGLNVLYEESLDPDVLAGAVAHISRADMLIVGGTSLQVYPAAGLINYYSGNKLVLINKTITPYDSYANLVINDSIGKVLSAAVE